jgi:hypothetical protein
MRGKGLWTLLAVTVVAVAVAVLAVRGSGAPRNDPLVGQAVLPEVVQRLADVGRVTLVHGSAKITLLRHGEHWVVEEKDDYPANDVKVRQALLGLADLSFVEPKTSKTDLYSRLDVEDADKKDAKSILVTVADEKGSLLGELITGKRRVDQLGGGNDGIYVRKPGATQSWLARGTLDVAGDASQWLDKKLIDLPQAKIKDATLTAADGGTLSFKRDKPEDKFALAAPPPAGKQLKSGDPLDAPAGALGGLELADVKAAKDFEFPKTGVAEARYDSFDGLTITISLVQKDGKDWARIAASGTGDAEKQAANLNARFSPWVYALESYKAKMLQTKLDDVVETPKGS